MTKLELRKQWEARVKEYKTSNMGISAWCKAKDIKVSTFRYWLDKEKSKNVMPREPEVPRWLPVEIDNKPEKTTEGLFIVKVGSASIEVREGFNKKLFQDIISVLVSSC